MGRRDERREAIRRIVRERSIRTQQALVDALVEDGCACTQATVSRDIAEMGLCKLAEGVYVLAEDLHLQRVLSEFVVGAVRSESLVVVRCQPGTATGVAGALDEAGLDHLLGTVAGTDTVLAVGDGAAGAELVRQLVVKLAQTG